jgi:ribonuclease P protein component
MRALFFDNHDRLVDGIYVFVAKERMSQMSYEALKKGFIWSLKRLECLK